MASAVAGNDLQEVATAVAEALQRPLVIAIPALGEPVIAPPGAIDAEVASAIGRHAGAMIEGDGQQAPEPISETVAVRIGDQVVGVVAAARSPAAPSLPAPEQRAWLEAAAAAASVTALIREAHGAGAATDSPQQLLTELVRAAPDNLPAFLVRARRLGHELDGGGVAICAWPSDGEDAPVFETPPLMATRPGGRLLLVTGLADAHAAAKADPPGEQLRAAGLHVCESTPRRDPGDLHHAVVEAELLAELSASAAILEGLQDTYRLLIGVLARDRDELAQLRDRTITPLADYDDAHDAELLSTLHAFLAHDGSTTETADAMRLHRHTVGYRLSRVQEVSGLSPYESDGRERLSLGIKARQILAAEQRRNRWSSAD